jgi:hypothetical protein
MRGFVYIVTRDFGFAPNPFGSYCTLATCKPIIRKTSEIGDIIIGYSPKKDGNKIVYAMKVLEKISFNKYWNDNRFQYKKPALNGSLVRTFGDNIYFNDGNEWHQADSHHSLETGDANIINLKRDTKADFVLISTDFFYFGIKRVDIPSELKIETYVERAHRILTKEKALSIWEYLESEYHKGLIGDPMLFKNGFSRYNGI